MDARLHHVQGKTERVKPPDLLALLLDLYRDKLALRLRHESAARGIKDYDFNNTYQYIIAREDTHLSWLRSAVAGLGGSVADVPVPSTETPRGDEAEILAKDAAEAQAFVDRWRDRIETVTNARHRTMLRLVLGETLEHKRFFDQAGAGRTDLLGRRADGAGTGGGVMPTRWVE